MAFTKILGPGIATDTNVQVGILTATAFYGDASNLTGIPAGLGTAVSQDQTNPLNKIYYTDQVLSIGQTVTVNVPSSAQVAYTQYAEVAVENGYDFIVEDGDDFISDVLGLSTEGLTPITGAGGRVRADNFTNKAGTGAPNFPNGINVTGVVSATSFVGDGSALTGISKTLTIGVRVGTAVTFTLTGSSFNVSGRSGNISISI